MQNQSDYETWKARWERQRRKWQLAAVKKLDKAEGLLNEAAALRALMNLADDQIARGPD